MNSRTEYSVSIVKEMFRFLIDVSSIIIEYSWRICFDLEGLKWCRPVTGRQSRVDSRADSRPIGHDLSADSECDSGKAKYQKCIKIYNIDNIT